jgi:serine/threonine-protein kinase RsbT
MSQLASGLQLFLQDPDKFRACKNALTEVATGSGPVSGETPQTVVVRIRAEEDVVRARAVGRDLSRRLGFTEVAQTKVATAISELARNIVNYAGVGEVSVRALAGTRRGVEVVARDEGPGIADLELVMSGNYRSKSGMGAGLRGTRRLVDEFEIDSQIGKGTTVRVRKYAE